MPRKPTQPLTMAAHPPSNRSGSIVDRARRVASAAQERFGRAMPRQPTGSSGATGSSAPTGSPAPAKSPENVDAAAGSQATVVQLALRPLLGRIGELAALSLCVNLLSLAVPVFVLQVYDRVVFHGGLVTLGGLVIGVLIAIGFDLVVRQARSRLVQMIALRVDIAVIRALFDRLTGLPLRSLETQTDAEWHRLLRDQEAVRDTLAGSSTLLLVDLPFIVLFLLVIWVVAAPIAWLLAAVVPVYVLFAAGSSYAIGRAAHGEQGSAMDREALTAQLVGGRATVKALGLGPALAERFESAQASLIERSLRRGSRVDGFTNVASSFGMLTTVLLTSVGAIAIVGQEMTIGGLIAANMLAARIVQPLTQLIGAWRGVTRFREAAARLDQLLGQPIERASTAVARARPAGVLSLESVRFAYDPAAAPVLDDLSFTLRPGGLHGIIGTNGSGKTTLLKVMQGLYPPVRGRVLIDGADIAQFGRHDLCRWIGYVPQDAFLFAGSVRDNIARGRSEVGDGEILAAARKAEVDPFVVELPAGYDTEVGEGGRRFSAGQRQRIALARALLDDPSILLLDEPSAHLDGEAARRLLLQLGLLARTRTVVVVTHSPAFLRACSTVLVLQDGRIAAAGPGQTIAAKLAPPTRRAPRPAARVA